MTTQIMYYASLALAAAVAAWVWVSSRMSLAACAMACCSLVTCALLMRLPAAREAVDAIVPGLRADAARRTRRLSDWLAS